MITAWSSSVRQARSQVLAYEFGQAEEEASSRSTVRKSPLNSRFNDYSRL